MGKLICSPPEVISRCSGLPLTQVRATQHTLLSKYGPRPVSVLKEAREKLCPLPFGEPLPPQLHTMTNKYIGCSSVDQLLNGGIFSAELTELWGPMASGKTQVKMSCSYTNVIDIDCSLQLCLSLTCGVISGSPYTVAYLDSSAGGFSSTHLQQHLGARGYGGGGAQEEEVMAYMMEKVHIYKVFSVFDLLSVLHSLQYHISNQASCHMWVATVCF